MEHCSTLCNSANSFIFLFKSPIFHWLTTVANLFIFNFDSIPPILHGNRNLHGDIDHILYTEKWIHDNIFASFYENHHGQFGAHLIRSPSWFRHSAFHSFLIELYQSLFVAFYRSRCYSRSGEISFWFDCLYTLIFSYPINICGPLFWELSQFMTPSALIC